MSAAAADAASDREEMTRPFDATTRIANGRMRSLLSAGGRMDAANGPRVEAAVAPHRMTCSLLAGENLTTISSEGRHREAASMAVAVAVAATAGVADEAGEAAVGREGNILPLEATHSLRLSKPTGVRRGAATALGGAREGPEVMVTAGSESGPRLMIPHLEQLARTQDGARQGLQDRRLVKLRQAECRGGGLSREGLCCWEWTL